MLPLIDLPPEVPAPTADIQWAVSEKSWSDLIKRIDIQQPHLLLAAGEPSALGTKPNAASESSSTAAPQYDIKLKFCDDVVGPNTRYRPDKFSNTNSIRPEFEVVSRILVPTAQEMIDPIGSGFLARGAALRKDAVVSVIQNPGHGKLLPVKKGQWSGYFYLADRGYFGMDKAVFAVKLNDGRTVLLEREISVIGTLPSGDACSTPAAEFDSWRTWNWDELKRIWDEGGVSANDIAPLFDESEQVWQLDLDAMLRDGSYRLSDLGAGVLGQASEDGIVLDATAAGHGWFIDPTPGDNSEFLPTSNPNEWIAKEGSAAYGKMDLLSVLLHRIY